MPGIKQLIVLRRKAGLTRQEFFDYHYQVHGAISTAPNPGETPQKYFQTHFNDSAYHPQGPNFDLNSHPPWAFGDDITELYFESAEHLQRVFQSSWVQEKVGPDGANFSDFSSVMPMFVEERTLSQFDRQSSHEVDQESPSRVATYFVSTNDSPSTPEDLVHAFAESLRRHAPHSVKAVLVNTPAEVSFDIGKYFGGTQSPHFDFVFMVQLQGSMSQPDIRSAQAEFESEFASCINLEMCWIAFGERAVVLDQPAGITVCLFLSKI